MSARKSRGGNLAAKDRVNTGTAIVNGLSIDVEEYFHAVNLRRAFPDTA